MKFLLVGSQFSQGAPAVLAKGLAQRAKVALVPEPENPYDPLAVKVCVAREEVVEGPEVEEALAQFGLSLEALSWPFVLGHLGASETTKAAKAAVKAGVKFAVVAEWHKLVQPQAAEGRLVFEGFGPITVEVIAPRATGV